MNSKPDRPEIPLFDPSRPHADEQALRQAVGHHQAGRLQQAERLYISILKTTPGHPDANHNLGALALQTNRSEYSLPCFKAALEACPKVGQYWISYIDALLKATQPDVARQVLALARQRGWKGNAFDALAIRLSLAQPGAGEPSPDQISHLGDSFNAGNWADSITLAKVLTRHFPGHAFGWKVLGAALQQTGQSAGALPALQNAVALNPEDAEAHRNLGIVQSNLGQLEAAIDSYHCALRINPEYAQAHNNLGIAWLTLGQLTNAATSFQRALEIKPTNALAYCNLGNIQKEIGLTDQAAASYRRALKLDPRLAAAHNNLGIALGELTQTDDAIASYRRALEIEPDFADAHSNLGNALAQLGQAEHAIASYRRALEIKPDFATAHNNLGIALQEAGQLDDAVQRFYQAVTISPDYAEARANMGNALAELGQLDDAVASFRLALRTAPDVATTHFNLGLCLLSMGQYREGWREYEYRRNGARTNNKKPAGGLPLWSGQPIRSGDRLLVLEEQGLGDRLQFARYLPLALDRFAGHVSLVSCSALAALLRRSFPNVKILESIPPDGIGYHWQSRLLSLPLAMDTDLNSIPGQAPYLIPDPQRVASWNVRITGLCLPPAARKVGLVWKTGNFMKNFPLRSLALKQLAPLLNLQDTAWFSLQKEPDADKLPWVRSGKLIDWTDQLSDFDETAALAANLDLIISVDTAAAHLSASLGRPTWLLNRHASEWRWMRNREDSAWYPSMRIFTQKKPGEWDEVVTRILLALDRMGVP